MDELIIKAEIFVRSALASHDASHDYNHIVRVRNLAKTIAFEEGLTPDDIKIVELAALLHDVADWKYQKEVIASQEDAVEAFLQENLCSDQTISRITGIIGRIGFKDELALPTSLAGGPMLGGPSPAATMSKEAMIVQDADRLDAIGAIGIARCLTFGGAFKRPLYDPAVLPRVGLTKEQYMNSRAEGQDTTINHFYEKLLLIKDKMKTAAGRRIALKRHQVMEDWLLEFKAEWEGVSS